MARLPLPDAIDRARRRDAHDSYYAPIRGAIHHHPQGPPRPALATRIMFGWLLALGATASVMLVVRAVDMLQAVMVR